MNTRSAALLYLALTLVVVAFHLAIIAGAPWGELTMGGRWPGSLPVAARVINLGSILLLSLMARAVAERAGMVRAVLPAWSIQLVLGFLALGVVMHVATPSAAERWLWLPQIVVQLACVIRVVRG